MEILKKGYNRAEFKKLIMNIFKKGNIFLEIPDMQENSDDKIEKGYLLGEFEFDNSEFAVFEYKVADSLDLERNKVGLNKRMLKEGKEYLYDFLIGVYYNEKTKVWRLSLINIEYNEKKDKTTSLKRYTYLLGENIPVNTATKQINDLINEKELKTIDELLKAFSVEPVTKEFFKRYKEIFEKFNEYSYKNYQSYEFLHIQDDEKSGKKKIRDFNKKLLGRLVFLMFLQKKGWLNASNNDYKDGDKNFLSNFYNKAIEDDKVFYNEFLEPLFYDTLNKNRKDDVFSITNKKIPFLNGGLFEKERRENSLFYPNELFTLLFDDKNGLFNQYNFTIIENDSYDQEVAVDPEMLGHIFENLLEDNKDKGAFYTPKEIVDYMSKSSLFEYLKTGFERDMSDSDNVNYEEILRELVFSPEIADFRRHFIENNREKLNLLLDNVKILDPAIGSGAFPMGMLQAIIRVKEVLNHNLNRGEAKRKIIENSIYGVDIESGAVDIARLRFWLSLVVDEEKPTPLPNLDFKIVVGNSLVSVLKTGNLEEVIDLSALRNNSVELDSGMLKKLLDAKNDFYEGKGDKKVLKEKIKGYERDILKVIFKHKIMKLQSTDKKYCVKDLSGKVKNHKKCEKYRNELLKLNETLEDIKTKDYYIFDYYLNFNEVFHGKGGFDIVIGNPPYMRVQGIERNISEKYKKLFKSATGSYDLYVLFTEKGLSLLKTDGILNYIMPHKWINSSFGKGLRELSKEKVYKFISFEAYQVFNASTYTSLVWFKNKNVDILNYVGLNKNLDTNIELEKYLKNLKDDDYTKLENKKLKSESWVFTDKKIHEILEKLKEQPLRVSDVFEKVFTGLQTSKDSVYFLFDCVENNDLIEGYSKELGKNIIIERGLVKPLLKGDDVHRYENLKTDKYVIFPYYKITENNREKAVLFTENEIKEKFPNGYNYLKECENILRNRERGKFNNNEWFQFGRKQGIIDADKEKIIQPDISLGGNYAYDKNGDFYSTTTLYGYIKYQKVKESYKFYMAILNSNLLWWYLTQTGTTLANGYFRFMPRYLNPFPLPKVSLKTTHPFETLVEQIIAIKKEENNVLKRLKPTVHSDEPTALAVGENSKLLEDKIDLMVYKLYKLTYDEIKIIDPDFDSVLNEFKIDRVKYENMSIEELGEM